MSRIPPSQSPDTAFFWEGAADHQLLIQRCTGCGTLRHPPRPMCPRCTSLDWDTVPSSGRGTVLSWVVPRHPVYPGYDDPNVVVLVELAEGVRLVSNLIDVELPAVAMGMPVEVRFVEHDGVVLPQFRPAAP